MKHSSENCNESLTYQNVLQFDVAVDEALTVQEADAVHHVERDLQSARHS